MAKVAATQNVVCQCWETVHRCVDRMARTVPVLCKVCVWAFLGCLTCGRHLLRLQRNCDFLAACWSVRCSRRNVWWTEQLERGSTEQSSGTSLKKEPPNTQKPVATRNYFFVCFFCVLFLWGSPERTRFKEQSATVCLTMWYFTPAVSTMEALEEEVWLALVSNQ